MGAIGVLVVVALITTLAVWLARTYKKYQHSLTRLQGPTARPLIGNLHQLRIKPDGKLN